MSQGWTYNGNTQTYSFFLSFFLWHYHKITSFRLNLYWPLLWYLYPEAETAKKETRKKKIQSSFKTLINFKTSAFCFHDTFKENERGERRKVRDCMICLLREIERCERTSGKKKRQTESCDCSVLQRVSPSLSPWQVGNIGELWAARPTLLHRGFTHWQTEPRAVLSTAHHSLWWSPTVWEPVSLRAAHPPVSFTCVHTGSRISRATCTSSKQLEN